MRARSPLLVLLVPAALLVATLTLVRNRAEPSQQEVVAAPTTTPSTAPDDGEIVAPVPRAESTRSEAPQTPKRPSYELAPLEARLVRMEGGTPIPFLRVALIDANGVRVDAISDRKGWLRSDALLQVGEVTLLTLPDEVRPQSKRYGFPSNQEDDRMQGGRPTKVDHGGTGDAPAVWRVRVPARFMLHLGGFRVMRGPLEAYAASNGDRQFSQLVLDRDTLGRPDVDRVATVPAGTRDGPWAPARIADVDAGRRLYVMHVADRGLFAGAVHVPRVPTAMDPPVAVELTEVTFAHEPRLEQWYGPRFSEILRGHLNGRLDARLAELRAERAGGHTITGTIASQSSTFGAALRIRARPTVAPPGGGAPYRASEGSVVWDEHGIGRFEIEGLDATTYRLRPVGSRAVVTRPDEVVVAAPAELGDDSSPTFLVLDELPTRAVAVRARSNDGPWLGGFRASMTATFEGATLRSAAIAVPLEDTDRVPLPTLIKRDVPVDATFRIEVRMDGFESATLLDPEFELEGDTLVATAILLPTVAPGVSPTADGRNPR